MDKMSDLVTFEECVEIVKRHLKNEDFELLDYIIEPFLGHVDGFLGEHYIIKTKVRKNSDTLSISFFAKIPLLQQNEFVRACKAFEKEIYFYKILIEEFKTYSPTIDESFLPRYYFSRDNDIIVLENLHEKDFRVAQFKDTMDVKHIKFILKVLAKFHSASIIYEERKSEKLGKTFRLIDNYEEILTEGIFQDDVIYLGNKWHTASRRGILNTIDLMDEMEVPKSEFKKMFNELTDRCIEIVKPSKIFRNVLTHGDLWMNNILFRYENDVPTECKFVDFQFIKYNPPAFDVLKIIYQSTTTKQRTQHFEDFLKYYYDNLCNELKLGDLEPTKIISRDEFEASVKYMLPQCKVETLYYYAYQKFGQEFLKTLHKNPEDFHEFTFIDRSFWMLQHYKPGSVYKKWVDEMMTEIKDMLLQYNITREDCYAILRVKLNTTDYDLLSYSAKMLEEKKGFQGLHLKLKINIKLNEAQITHKFFIKLMPQGVFNVFVTTLNSFNNEKFIFDNYFTKISQCGINIIYDCVAHHYYSRSNDIIAFEDLNEQGFQIADKYKPFNFDEMSIVIKCLAKFHACTLLLEENLTNNTHEFRVKNEYKNNITETYFVKLEGHLGFESIKAGLKGILTTIDKFPDSNSKISEEQLKHLVTIFIENTIYDQSSPSKRYRNVVCHGELWANNIMMKYVQDQPVDCRIVDYQTVRICPPAHDVMSLIYLTTSREFRDKYMSDILNLYHSELNNILTQYECNIEDILPLSEFLESCEEYKVFAINFVALLFPIIMLTSEEMEKFLSNQELCYHNLFIDRSDFTLDMCEKDKQYKALLKENVKDLRVLCENIDSKYVVGN